MIITCNCGLKKFSLPDNSIPSAGRMVQCGSCGLKWKQFPVNNILSERTPPINKSNILKKQSETKIPKSKKKKLKNRNKREIDLYSPEYLAKKHGINLNEFKDNDLTKNKVSFGFFNSLIFFIVIIIAISKGLYFAQDFIVQKFPLSEIYFDYFFESVRNLFEIWKNLISSY